ncbi:hypothetical protein OQA88_10451 [Cercophora sp. LCS_1]
MFAIDVVEEPEGVEDEEIGFNSADTRSPTDAATSAPPPLPPSVEEAYRRKCGQLRRRTNEVEEANDAARMRLARLKRQVEKMRLERAFLLEQLAKRTSTNVEDSDGSPSPPPTVSSPTSFPPQHHHRNHRGSSLLNDSQPKEKPLRIKRGHRKPSMLAALDTPGSSAAANLLSAGNNLHTHSPSSDAFSTQHVDKTNGTRGPPKKPGTAFELYCDETRPELKEKVSDEGTEEEQLARGWKDLGDNQREEFQTRADDEMAKYRKEKDAYEASEAAADAKKDKEGDETEMDIDGGGSTRKEGDDGDVEMGNYDTDEETKPEE